MPRQEPSTGNDDSALSLLDIFANGMGCVLMLMVVFILRISVSTGGSGVESRPTMVTVAWSSEAPPTGTGAARLRMRVLHDAYRGTNAPSLPDGNWKMVSTSGTDHSNSSSVSERHESLVLLAPELRKNSEWTIEVGIDFGELPVHTTRNATHPFEILAGRIDDRLKKLNQPTYRPVAEAEILKLADDHRQFLEIISSHQAKWLAVEAAWEASSDTVTFAKARQERWQWARDCYEELRSLSYPSNGPAIDTGWYDVFMIDGVVQTPKFEHALTHQIGLELALADALGSSADLLESPSARWVSGIKWLIDPEFSLPIRVTFVGGVGDPIVDQEAILFAPFSGTSGDGWTALSTLHVDRKRLVRWDWKDIQPATASTVPTTVPPTTGTKVRLSKWDKITASLPRGDNGVVTESMDRALSLLASKQDSGTTPKSHGRFDKLTDTDGQLGPGVTGLCLMAYLAAGHTPDCSNSPHREVVLNAIENLVAVQESGGEFSLGATANAQYHHGFATMALAQSIPFLKTAAEQNSADAVDKHSMDRAKAILPQAEVALASAVKLLIGSNSFGRGDKGGWGYNKERDDTSVSAVQVKALVESYHLLPALKPEVEEALKSADKFFKSCRIEYGTYQYRLGNGTANKVPRPTSPLPLLRGSDPIWPARLPGCLLAECYCNSAYLASGEKKTWGPGLERFKLWDLKDGELKNANIHAYYALYYAAHLRYELGPSLEVKKNSKWLRGAARLVLAEQADDGSFQRGTYGTAMAVIALSLHMRHVAEDGLQ